jgi:hypothetical protein
VPSLLNRIHEPVKMGAERLQARGIQEEAALARRVGRSARGIAALLGRCDLLAEEARLARGEAQVRHWDGGHVHIIRRA